MVNRTQVLVLLAAVMIIGAASHRVLPDTNPGQRSLLNLHEVSAESTARQRILEELEEVHQLRERMLQEGILLGTSMLQLKTTKCCTNCCIWPRLKECCLS